MPAGRHVDKATILNACICPTRDRQSCRGDVILPVALAAATDLVDTATIRARPVAGHDGRHHRHPWSIEELFDKVMATAQINVSDLRSAPSV